MELENQDYVFQYNILLTKGVAELDAANLRNLWIVNSGLVAVRKNVVLINDARNFKHDGQATRGSVAQFKLRLGTI